MPDPKRPFVVSHAGLSARAVGTRFVVRADGADSPVGVAEGRVEVSVAGRHALVSAGQAVRVGDDAGLVVSAANVDRSTAWREGRLVFAGQSLATVLAELGRYRHGRIVLLDRALGKRRVTGAFDARDTDDALDVIAATMGAASGVSHPCSSSSARPCEENERSAIGRQETARSLILVCEGRG